MALMIGGLLALGAGLLGSTVGLDRDRAYYPTMTIVVGSYYVLFAAMGASTDVALLESLVGMIFLVAAVYGFRSSLWVTAIALAGHGVFDLVHGRVIANPGVPVFWPAFCSAFDVTAGVYLAWRLTSRRIRAAA